MQRLASLPALATLGSLLAAAASSPLDPPSPLAPTTPDPVCATQPPPAPDGRRGVVTTFVRGAARDLRVDRMLALYVPEGAPPTPFLEPGPFAATLETGLRIDLLDDYRFHLAGRGRAVLEVDGKTLLETELSDDGVETDLVELDQGVRALTVRYTSPPDGAAGLRVGWSSFDFGREPVPPHVLALPESARLDAAMQLRHGRLLVAESGCIRCHALGDADDAGDRMPELERPAPDLAHAGRARTQSWLARWIRDPSSVHPGARMPALPAATAPEVAADLASYLAESAGGSVEAPLQPPRGETARGARLVASLGCMHCHAHDRAPPWQTLGHGWRPGALARFLQVPRRAGHGTGMPHFGLSDDEAGALAAYLATTAAARPGDEAGDAAAPSTGPGHPARADSANVDTANGDTANGDTAIGDTADGDTARGNPARGADAFLTLGCSACHDRPGRDAAEVVHPTHPPAWAELRPGRGCTDAAPGETAPRYAWNAAQREAVVAFLAADGAGASLVRTTDAEYAARALEASQCNACHARDGEPARWPPARPGAGAPSDGEPALLQDRPALTWTGAKLHTTEIEAVLSDPTHERARPWLTARMPEFGHVDALRLARGLAHQHGLPASRPETPSEAGTDPVPDGPGERLIQAFACTTCHDRGALQATAAFDAKGPDLARIPARLRRDFFVSWMLHPERFVAGTRMPRFALDGRTAVLDAFDGDGRRQFEAIYDALRAGPR